MKFIHDIIEHGSIQDLKKALEEGANPDDLNSIEGELNGETPLFYANTKQSALLIKYGANVNHINKYNENALFYISFLEEKKGCNIEKIKKINLLMDNKIDLHQKNINQENFIFNSNLDYDFQFLRFLEDIGVDFKCLNNDKEHFLFSISDHTSIDVIKYLLKNFIDINQENKKQETLIFSTENTCFLKYYIDNGLDINKQNINGETILTLTSNFNVMKFCLDNDINIHLINKEGLNALDNCMFHTDIVQALIDKGSQILQNIEFYKSYNNFYLIDEKIKKDLSIKEKKYISNQIINNDVFHGKKRI